jgi:hypothetical protein
MSEQTPEVETTLLSTPESEVAEVAAKTDVEGKPADAIAKEVAEETEEETLLGKEDKKDPDAPVKTTPDKYEFKVPEGFTLDPKAVETFEPLFKEDGLSQERAQKYADAFSVYTKNRLEEQQKQLSDGYKETVNSWKKETSQKLGPEPAKELAYAAKVINKFSSDPVKLRAELNETGAGNRFFLTELLVKVGKAFGEDTIVEPNKDSQGNTQDAFLRKHYPTMQT